MAETKYNITNTLVNVANITSGTPIVQLLNGIAQGVNWFDQNRFNDWCQKYWYKITIL